MKIAGLFKLSLFDKFGNLKEKWEQHNGITVEGKNHILDVQFDSEAQITSWYLGLIDNASYTGVDEDDVMASHAGWIEFTDYSEGTREAWAPASASDKIMLTDTAAEYTITADGTLKGVFVVSNNAKSGATGTLWSTAIFSSNKVVENGDTLKVEYELEIS